MTQRTDVRADEGRGVTGARQRATLAGGWILAVASVAHLGVFLGVGGRDVSGWFTGDLWSKNPLWDDPSMAHSTASYWASLGGFAVPLFLLGCHAIAQGRRGRAVPLSFALVLLVWFVINAIALEPSGFPLGVVAAVLLVIGARRSQRQPT